MPLQRQNVEVILWQGLEQKTDAKSTTMGKLEIADNVEFDKRGSLNKRKGYMEVDVSEEVFGETTEETLMALGVFEGELLVFAYDRLYAIADKNGGIDDNYVVDRGPPLRGNISKQIVFTTRTGTETFGVG